VGLTPIPAASDGHGHRLVSTRRAWILLLRWRSASWPTRQAIIVVRAPVIRGLRRGHVADGLRQPSPFFRLPT